LDATGDWTNEFRELKDQDNRGPLKETEEQGTGDGRYSPSWIWAAPSAMTLPSEGSAAEQQEVNETARHEWMTCRARADRWTEEEELLQEEMRRVIAYLEWKSRAWSEKVGTRTGSCTPDIQRGADAYARKQANIHHEIAVSFASQWLPYLKTYSLDTKWAAGFPWASEITSRKVNLPKQFSPPATDGATTAPPRTLPVVEPSLPDAEGSGTPPCTLPAAESSPPSTEGLGIGQEQEYPGSDEEGSDDEDEDYSDDEGEGSDDGAETNDDLGFEYDDEYMS
jgi:hypothetical protein